MWRTSFCVVIAVLLQHVNGFSELLCGNKMEKTLSCTTQILGHGNTDSELCKMVVYAADSPKCEKLNFGDLTPNIDIGGITLKPYIMTTELNKGGLYSSPYNNTVLNITFSNIKWKTMKFRFQDRRKYKKNHCNNIILSNNLTVDDRSVLYYDCYWAKSDNNNNQSHILDFEASDQDMNVNRGRYYFNIPSIDMLSPTVTEENWKPFIYVELSQATVRLHIVPPPSHLKITGYVIKVMKECPDEICELKSFEIDVRNNNTDEVYYDHNIIGENGNYLFLVKPLHDKCKKGTGCKVVKSPTFVIKNEHQTLNICIASITALVVAILFAYYIALRVIRKYWCKDYRLASDVEILPPTKVLVIYSPANRLHAECVASFVSYLRQEYGFDVMYDGDISSTSHGDPYIWADEAFRLSSHIMYIVGPSDDSYLYNSIYDKPIITAHKDVDVLLLSFIKTARGCRSKSVLNVFFEHSNGQIPIETRHDKVFFLLKDWQKLISYLSKNLLPKKQIMRTERGRSFLDDLTRAKKLLSVKKDEVVVRCEKSNAFEKKILL